MALPHSLSDIQQWFQTTISHPAGVDAATANSGTSQGHGEQPVDIARVILPSEEMNSEERLQIYSRAYFGRLIECLRAQFPAVHHAIRDDAFDGLAFGFLVDHPSRSYSLGTLGQSFDAHLRATRPKRQDLGSDVQFDFADFLIDLARLEWTYNEVFDGPGPEQSRSLQAVDLMGLSAEDFAQCRLVLHECVRLLELQFPVHEYASVVRKGADAVPPAARPVRLVVTRRDYIVRRLEVSPQQFELLSALNDQKTIGESLQLLCEKSNVEYGQLAIQLQTWFQEWSAAPLFQAIDHGN